MPPTFFDDWSDSGKISKIDILPNCHQSSKNVAGMIFHAFGCIYFNFFDVQYFDQILNSKMFSFKPKMGFSQSLRLINSQNLNFLSRSVQKLFHQVRSEFKGQFLYSLAAFKVTNCRKGALTHEV